MKEEITKLCLLMAFLVKLVQSSDITDMVFENLNDAIVAAYGDFNSDELTDVFILRDDFKTIEILLASDTTPLLKKQRENFRCHYPDLHITSIVPGDFDGDTFMDVMFTARGKRDNEINVYINYGESYRLNCTTKNDTAPVAVMIGEPLALDYNNDMIIDLFGVRDKDKLTRSFWIFHKDRSSPQEIDMETSNLTLSKLVLPHSHAFLDLNDDSLPDLCLTTERGFEAWIADSAKDGDFHFEKLYDYPTGDNKKYGQAVYMDLELNGNLYQLLPACHDEHCKESKIWVRSFEHYHELSINFFRDDNKTQWGFLPPNEHGEFYEKTITLRVGDFNNDGYPDLLATLERKDGGDKMIQTFLLENVKNTNAKESDKFKRTFTVRWSALDSVAGQNTVMGSFYDFYQDGILDVIMLQRNNGNKYKPMAFRNTLDYDANFVKVIVLTGLDNPRRPKKETHPFGGKSRSYGTNLPGPKIKYKTTTQEGEEQKGTSTQLPQSAYLSLHLPYQIFGLGRTPNFVDYVEIALAGKSKSYPQIIPNSQMQVIPKDPFNPYTWKAQLFVTPSKVIIQSVIALLGKHFLSQFNEMLH
jgi:integrin alpha FG-GAP repeat containing protein 1